MRLLVLTDPIKMAAPTPPVEGIYSAPTGLFTDEEFLSAAQQVQNPRLEGWELFVECMGVKIHRKYREVCLDVTTPPRICAPLSIGHWAVRVQDSRFNGGIGP